MTYTDLTQFLKRGTRGFDIETARTLEKDHWNATTLHIYSHAGTHMDSPWHFGVSSRTIDEYPVDRFFSSCRVIDVPGCKPSQAIKPADLDLPAGFTLSGEGVMLRTGWSRFAGTGKYRDELPRISPELATWLVENGVRMLGVEPPSVADVNNPEELTRVHTILLGGDIIIIEGLCNLDKIRGKEVQVVALPLKIYKGDGAPCRVIAIEP